jgi:acyl-CoA thioester hydrolase
MANLHTMRIRVRYSETDQMGVVHHASYLIYLEEGRTALMRDLLDLPYEEVERSGFAFAVRKLDVRYRQAARYGDELTVRTHIERMRGASITYGYRLERDSDTALIATGSVETVCMALESMAPASIPDHIRAAVEKLGV